LYRRVGIPAKRNVSKILPDDTDRGKNTGCVGGRMAATVEGKKAGCFEKKKNTTMNNLPYRQNSMVVFDHTM
jgi:hypothetical protein